MYGLETNNKAEVFSKNFGMCGLETNNKAEVFSKNFGMYGLETNNKAKNIICFSFTASVIFSSLIKIFYCIPIIYIENRI